MAADAAHELQTGSRGPWPPDDRRRWRPILPSFATTTNPVDITAALLTNSGLFGTSCGPGRRPTSIDVLFVALPVAGVGYDVPAFAQAAADFMPGRTGRSRWRHRSQLSRAYFGAAGVPVFASQTAAKGARAARAPHAADAPCGAGADRGRTPRRCRAGLASIS